MFGKLVMWASGPLIRIHSVGPDALSEDDIPPHINPAVYYYEVRGYEGNGNFVFHDANTGKWGCKSLGHCSCYGPLEELEEADFRGTMTWRELFKLVKDDSTGLGRHPGDYEYDQWKAIQDKLKELREEGLIPGLRKKKGRKK